MKVLKFKSSCWEFGALGEQHLANFIYTYIYIYRRNTYIQELGSWLLLEGSEYFIRALCYSLCAPITQPNEQLFIRPHTCMAIYKHPGTRTSLYILI